MRFLKSGIILGAFLLASVSYAAEPGELALKNVMQDLESRMESIVAAIAVDDFDSVEFNALHIADHEKPPVEERKKIVGFLGADAAGFQAADAVVHDTATRLAEAAASHDAVATAKFFGALLDGCVKCHTGYRQRIVEHFYKD